MTTKSLVEMLGECARMEPPTAAGAGLKIWAANRFGLQLGACLVEALDQGQGQSHAAPVVPLGNQPSFRLKCLPIKCLGRGRMARRSGGLPRAKECAIAAGRSIPKMG